VSFPVLSCQGHFTNVYVATPLQHGTSLVGEHNGIMGRQAAGTVYRNIDTQAEVKRVQIRAQTHRQPGVRCIYSGATPGFLGVFESLGPPRAV
jgi:hypothetical protein